MAFKIKLITEQLPTRLKLHSRYPSIYSSNKCPRCLLIPETFNHIFTCSTNNINLPIISLKIKKYLLHIISESNLPPNNQPSAEEIQNLKIDGTILLDWARGFSTFNSNLDIKCKAKIMVKSIKILNKYIWIPRLTTANTSTKSGTKWKKCTAVNSSNQSHKQIYQFFDQTIDCFLVNNSTSPNSELTNQIIINLNSLNSTAV
jgi:hypothetical protein